MKPGVVGLDLSLRSPAACWIPRGWKGDTRQLKAAGKGWGTDLKNDATEAEHLDRMERIARSVALFCLARRPVAVYVEQYAFSKANSTSAVQLHECGGIVKHFVREALGLPVIAVTASAARKTLLQKLPKKDSKQFTEDNVRRLGGAAVYWSGDEVDAFVVANHGARLQGWVPLSYEGK